jgi:hypothetical protein
MNLVLKLPLMMVALIAIITQQNLNAQFLIRGRNYDGKMSQGI